MGVPTGKQNKFSTREEWLEAAVILLTPLYTIKPVPVRVGVGFPVGKRNGNAKTIGQCHYAAQDGVPQIFIHPEIVDPVRVLDILAHELIHAYLPVGAGHKGAFGAEAKEIGLTGPNTATVAGPDLVPLLKRVSATLGKYPHAALTWDQAKGKTQTTRMLKASCEYTQHHADEAEYIVRISRQQAERGLPICPCCYEETGEIVSLQLSL